jgi:hypothetical protein
VTPGEAFRRYGCGGCRWSELATRDYRPPRPGQAIPYPHAGGACRWVDPAPRPAGELARILALPPEHPERVATERQSACLRWSYGSTASCPHYTADPARVDALRRRWPVLPER